VGEAGDFLGEQFVPQFPTQARSKLPGNSRRPTAVLALDGNNSDHALSI
jgi:hypothetical protein